MHVVEQHSFTLYPFCHSQNNIALVSENFAMPERPYYGSKLPIKVESPGRGILAGILDKEEEGGAGDYLQCQSDLTDSSLLGADTTMDRSVSMIIDSDDC